MCRIFSEQPQRLREEDPAEDGEAGERGGEDDGVAGERGVAAHLLCHRVGSDGAGRCEDGEQRDELDAAEAEQRGGCEHEGRRGDEADEDAGPEVAAALADAAAPERGAEDDERERRRRGTDLHERPQQRIRQRERQQAAEEAEQHTVDHRVLQHAAQDRQQAERTAAECLEREDGVDVVERDDNGDHHRRHERAVLAEDVDDEREAEDDKVAAEDCLRHGAAPLPDRLEETGEREPAEKEQRDGGRAEEHETRVEAVGEVRVVDIGKEREEKEDAEHETIRMRELLFREQMCALDEQPDADEHEDRHDGAHRDDEIAEQENSPSVVTYLHYATTGGELHALPQKDAHPSL